MISQAILVILASLAAPDWMASWSTLLDQCRADSSMEEPRGAWLAAAREMAAQPIVRRAATLADVGRNRTWLDGRAHALEDEIKQDFALAMSDFGACRLLADELPAIAAAYRVTGDPALLRRVIEQLAEMAKWSPLQRPGWTLYAPGNRLPEDGKDGNWLATGTGVRAIADTLEILPPDAVDPALRDQLHGLLQREIAGVCDDWQVRRPWFVRGNDPISNQWVLPTEGLVRASLVLGADKNRDAYELGVKNLLAALDAHGPQGEFEEGYGYAAFTVTAMLHAAHAMAVAGDRRAVDHPFLQRFSTWLVHHFQPGNLVINCFDAGGAYGAAHHARPLLSLLTVCTGSPVARWALTRHLDGPSQDLAGLAARALPPVGPDAQPPLFACYERAARINWRNSWDVDASGVWMRGGHKTDQHDHQDRGHVNFIAHGKPILIEAGTPSYHHKLMMSHYSSGAGHNVLQVGTAFPDVTAKAGATVVCPGWQKEQRVAPITVARLDRAGGEAAVDGSACYDNLVRWHRKVAWNLDQIEISDDVALADGKDDVILFRWHLGTEADATIAGDAKAWTAAWGDAVLAITAGVPVTVSQSIMPDNTLKGHTGDESPANFHTCIIVQTAEKVAGCALQTVVKAVN